MNRDIINTLTSIEEIADNSIYECNYIGIYKIVNMLAMLPIYTKSKYEFSLIQQLYNQSKETLQYNYEIADLALHLHEVKKVLISLSNDK